MSRVLSEIRQIGGLQGKDIANIVDASPATVSRWFNDQAVPNIRTQTVIADLRYIVDRLSEFYASDETRLWLFAKHPLLDHERPIDLINAGNSRRGLDCDRASGCRRLSVVAAMRRARDPELLDAVDACPREPFSGVAWRIVRENRDPLLGTRVGGRWCWPGTFDVLYTSLEPEGEGRGLFPLEPPASFSLEAGVGTPPGGGTHQQNLVTGGSALASAFGR